MQMRAVPQAMQNEALGVQYAEQGYVGPLRVLSVADCRRFLHAVRQGQELPPNWGKGHAASSRPFYEIGMDPAIVDVVAALLGEDVMLWGASIQTRPPGAVHPWHCDVESAGPAGRTVSVWIGLEHSNSDSSLVLMSHSHRFGASVQELRHRHGVRREEASDEQILSWAQEHDRESRIVRHGVADGEALFFDGRLWHGSHNLSDRCRRALLLQYASADTEIRIPDSNYLDWPFRSLASPRPACVMVKGSARSGVNHVVSGPVAADGGAAFHLGSRIYPMSLPLAPDDEKGWKPYAVFRGATAELGNLSCHVSVLNQDQCPHPPHRHDDEEILLVLDGEVDLVLPDLPGGEGGQRRRLQTGEFVYYPARFAHTLETRSRQPANYLMFKWLRNARPDADAGVPLAFGHFKLLDRLLDLDPAAPGPGYRHGLVCEGPTGLLGKLQCHVSTLAPGAGYEPHIDAYDVAIIVLEGEVETLGERAGAHSVIFYASGEPHGMRNPGEVTARYVVFEFHGHPRAAAASQPRQASSWLGRLADPRRWKRKVQHLLAAATRLH